MRVEYAKQYADLYRRHWWWRARERVLVREISLALRGRRARPRILDVGCGGGLFFNELSRIGDVYGVERDASLAAQSGSWRDRIFVGDVRDLRSAAHFDMVLLLDVLEHVTDPLGMLKAVQERLEPGGLVIVTVPAFRWLWTSHDVLNDHVTRMSRSEVVALMSASGLSVRSARYLFASLVVPKLLTRLVESLRSAKPTAPAVPYEPVNALLQWCLYCDALLGQAVPLGTSVLAIAHQERC